MSEQGAIYVSGEMNRSAPACRLEYPIMVAGASLNRPLAWVRDGTVGLADDLTLDEAKYVIEQLAPMAVKCFEEHER